MKIGIIHPKDSHNAGDKVILQGCMELLSKAYGTFTPVYCDFDYGGFYADNVSTWSLDELHYALSNVVKTKIYLDDFISQQLDMVVVSGTPWIWDMCFKSDKYRKLKYIVENLSAETKLVGLGLGSCFPLATNTMSMYATHPEKLNFLKRGVGDIFNTFDLITSRDTIAHETFKAIGVNNLEHHYCPANFIHINGIALSKSKPVLVFYNPFHGISASVTDKVFADDYIQYQVEFIKRYKPRIITMDKEDKDWLVDHNFTTWEDTNCIWVKEVSELIASLADASFVLSGRIHAAIPAMLMGKSTYIMPIDTRYLTTSKTGIRPLWTWGNDYYSINEFDFIDYKNSIEEDKQKLITRLKEIA